MKKLFGCVVAVLGCFAFTNAWAMDGAVLISKSKVQNSNPNPKEIVKAQNSLTIDPNLSQDDLSILETTEYSLENVVFGLDQASIHFPVLRDEESEFEAKNVRGVNALYKNAANVLTGKDGKRIRGIAQLDQKAIIVWNGKSGEDGRQLTIQSSEMVGLAREADSVLGIVPLPSKPISLARAGWEFDSLENFSIKKMEISNNVAIDQPSVRPVRAFYCAFDLEVPSLEQWEKSVNNALCANVPNAAIKIDDDVRAVLKDYYDGGFKNFIFDVYDIRPIVYGVIKSPIKFEFQTDKPFFPVHSVMIGYPRRFTFGIIALAPSPLDFDEGCSWKNFGRGKDKFDRELYHIGHSTFELTKDELAEYSPSVSEFCKQYGIEKLYGCFYVGVVQETMAGADDIWMSTASDENDLESPNQNESDVQDAKNSEQIAEDAKTEDEITKVEAPEKKTFDDAEHADRRSKNLDTNPAKSKKLKEGNEKTKSPKQTRQGSDKKNADGKKTPKISEDADSDEQGLENKTTGA